MSNGEDPPPELPLPAKTPGPPHTPEQPDQIESDMVALREENASLSDEIDLTQQRNVLRDKNEKLKSEIGELRIKWEKLDDAVGETPEPEPEP